MTAPDYEFVSAAESDYISAAEPEIVPASEPEIVAEPEPDDAPAPEGEIPPEQAGENGRNGDSKESGALAEILAWNGTIHWFPRELYREQSRLKYLGFVPEVFWAGVMYISCVYETVKGWFGPLKQSIDNVEESAKPIFGRAYRTVNVNPEEVLVKADRKVDGLLSFLDAVLPGFVTRFCSRAYNGSTTIVARVSHEGLKRSAKTYFYDHLPVFEVYVISAYKSAIRVPLVAPFFATIRFFAVIFNKGIIVVKKLGLPLSSYLPLLPVEYFDRLTRED